MISSIQRGQTMDKTTCMPLGSFWSSTSDEKSVINHCQQNENTALLFVNYHTWAVFVKLLPLRGLTWLLSAPFTLTFRGGIVSFLFRPTEWEVIFIPPLFWNLNRREEQSRNKAGTVSLCKRDKPECRDTGWCFDDVICQM